MVTTEYKELDGSKGYGSLWYGWSRDLFLTLDEAESLKGNLKDNYYDIEIVKIK